MKYIIVPLLRFLVTFVIYLPLFLLFNILLIVFTILWEFDIPTREELRYLNTCYNNEIFGKPSWGTTKQYNTIIHKGLGLSKPYKHPTND